MAQLISTASNSSYNQFDTKIPELDDSSDIVEAFRLYHYGKENYEDNSAPAADSIHAHLASMKADIEALKSNPPVINGLLLMGA